ncbi:hypothetical protein D4S03_11090 [bacterium]|nr:MAG: hypothetical protein D4S03_11090 [bacterium]
MKRNCFLFCLAALVSLLFILTAPAMAQTQQKEHQITGTLSGQFNGTISGVNIPSSSAPTMALVKEGGKWVYKQVDASQAVGLTDESAKDLVNDLSAAAAASRRAAATEQGLRGLDGKVTKLDGKVGNLSSSLDNFGRAYTSIDDRLSRTERAVNDPKTGLSATHKLAEAAASPNYWLWGLIFAAVAIGIIAFIRAGGDKTKTSTSITPKTPSKTGPAADSTTSGKGAGGTGTGPAAAPPAAKP